MVGCIKIEKFLFSQQFKTTFFKFDQNSFKISIINTILNVVLNASAKINNNFTRKS